MAATTPRMPLMAIVLARVGDHLLFKAYRVLGDQGPPHRASAARCARAFWWHETAAVAPTTSRPAFGLACEHRRHPFSGGTTSQPKGILLSNRAFVAQAAGNRVESAGTGRLDARCAAGLPRFRACGVHQRHAHGRRARGAGAAVFCRHRRRTPAARQTHRDGWRADTVRCAHARPFARINRPLAIALSFAVRIPCRARSNRASRRWSNGAGGHVKLLEGYGLTEAVSGIMGMPLKRRATDRLAYRFRMCWPKSARPGTIEALPPDTEGEICLAGPTLMDGYLNDPAATAKRCAHADGRVWLHIGRPGPHGCGRLFPFHGAPETHDQSPPGSTSTRRTWKAELRKARRRGGRMCGRCADASQG